MNSPREALAVIRATVHPSLYTHPVLQAANLLAETITRQVEALKFVEKQMGHYYECPSMDDDSECDCWRKTALEALSPHPEQRRVSERSLMPPV